MLFDPWNRSPTRLSASLSATPTHATSCFDWLGLSTAQRRVHQKILMNCPLEKKNPYENLTIINIWRELRGTRAASSGLLSLRLWKYYFWRYFSSTWSPLLLQLKLKVCGARDWMENEKNPRTRIARHSTVRKFRRFFVLLPPSDFCYGLGVFFCFFPPSVSLSLSLSIESERCDLITILNW